MTLILRLLDPHADAQLYREAWQWRPTPKRHVQPDRLPFEDFASDNPTHLTVGLFNGELLAVYFFHEIAPAVFQAHFTSKRGVSRDALLTGAHAIVTQMLAGGAESICAWVVPRNRPLCRFLEELGFACVGEEDSCCQSDSNGSTLPIDRTFLKYEIH